MTKCDLGLELEEKNVGKKYNVFDYVGDLFLVTSRHTINTHTHTREPMETI